MAGFSHLKPLCGSNVGNGEGSKNSTRTGEPRSNNATTASNAFGASEVLEELEEELKSEHEVNQTSNGPMIIPGQTLHKILHDQTLLMSILF